MEDMMRQHQHIVAKLIPLRNLHPTCRLLYTGMAGLPDTVTDEMLQEDDAFLQLYHHALLELILEEGALICPETGRRFPVSKGIPNLLLHEDEC